MATSGKSPTRAWAWTHEKLIQAVRAEQKAGRALNASSMEARRQGLMRAARRLFGSWDATLAAAGLDPSRIRQRAVRRHWTRSAVLDAIRERRRRREPLAHSAVPGALATAARRLLGSWRDALVAANVHPEEVQRRPPYTEAFVLSEIRKLSKGGGSMKGVDVARSKPWLVNAALRHCGGWRAALRAAGVSDKQACRWSQERTTRELTQLHAAGTKLTSTVVRKRHPTLWDAAIRYFGSWSAAKAAAGLRRAERVRESSRRMENRQ